MNFKFRNSHYRDTKYPMAFRATLIEWDGVGQPVYSLLKSNSKEVYAYQPTALDDLEVRGGVSHKWDGVHKAEKFSLSGIRPCNNSSIEYSEYSKIDKCSFSDMCRGGIGYHSSPIVISPSRLTSDLVADLIGAWYAGDPVRQAIEILLNSDQDPPEWLYLLGMFGSDSLNIFITSVYENLEKILLSGANTNGFDVECLSLPEMMKGYSC